MPLAVSYVNRFSMALMYGRTGRLTAKNGGFRPGQTREKLELSRQRAAAEVVAEPEGGAAAAPEPSVRQKKMRKLRRELAAEARRAHAEKRAAAGRARRTADRLEAERLAAAAGEDAAMRAACAGRAGECYLAAKAWAVRQVLEPRVELSFSCRSLLLCCHFPADHSFPKGIIL